MHTVIEDSIQSWAYLWAAGQEGLNVDVGVMHFEIVIPKASGDSDGRQHTSLQRTREAPCESNQENNSWGNPISKPVAF